MSSLYGKVANRKPTENWIQYKVEPLWPLWMKLSLYQSITSVNGAIIMPKYSNCGFTVNWNDTLILSLDVSMPRRVILLLGFFRK